MKTLHFKFASLRPASSSLLAAAVAATSLTAVTAPAQGGLMRDMSLDPQHQAFGNTYRVGGSALANTGGGVGALRISASAGVPFNTNGSITFLNSQWGAVALHEFQPYLDAGGTITASAVTGSNFLNNPGFTTSIAQIIPFPGGSSNNPALADFALVRFATAIPGMNDAVFGSFPGVDTDVFMAGYGRYGSEAAGIFPRDGNVRGWQAPLQSFITGGFNPSYYGQAQCEPDLTQALLGRGITGDSGGGVFDSMGRTIGLMVAGTNGSQFGGQTTILRFDNPEIASFISSTVPSPGAAVVLAGAGVLAAARRRR